MDSIRQPTAGDDAGALRAVAAGDRAALHALYDREAPRMIGIALRIVRRRELAEEAVQEAFIRIWNRAGDYDPALGSPRAWMYTIVRRLALNMVRDGRREDLVDDEALAALAEAGAPHEEALARLADGSALRRCLERLEARRRDSLMLAYVGGLSHGEIAGRLGIPLGTVKAWIRRSLLALRECLA
ncbi:MAG: sigma-70 family RNA polymerase sigma factor [Rhodospirillales bacterium]